MARAALPDMGMPRRDVSRRATPVTRLQAAAQFAGEEVSRRMAVSDLQNDEPAFSRRPLHSSFERRGHFAVVLRLGRLGPRRIGWPRRARATGPPPAPPLSPHLPLRPISPSA